MARYPRPGQVKTRLAADIGTDAACAFYTAFLRDIASNLSGGPWKLVWAVHPPGADLATVVPGVLEQIAQGGTNLAERMSNVFRLLFDRGTARVVMLGADAPHIGRDTVAAAFSALEDHDAAIVPTDDGGYCLIGLRAPSRRSSPAAADLFTGIEMGTATVLRDTLARAERQGLKALQMPGTFDLDVLDDLRRLEVLVRRGEVVLPETSAELRRMSGSLDHRKSSQR